MKRFLPLLAVLILCFSLTVPASAYWSDGGNGDLDISDIPNPYDALDSELRSYYPYALLIDAKQYGYPLARFFSTEPTPYLESDGTFYLSFEPYTGDMGIKTFIEFRYIPDNGFWQQTAYGSGGYTQLLSEVRASSFEVKYQGQTITPGGSDFFMTPLSETIQGVTAEVLNNQMVPTLGGTMKILTVCGVGCLALLMVLVLFGKRSQIFHI